VSGLCADTNAGFTCRPVTQGAELSGEGAQLRGQLADVLVLGHQLPVAPSLDLSREPVRICRFRFCSGQLRAERIALIGSFAVHLNQIEDLFSSLAQLQGQFLDFVFIDSELMPAGFKRRRAAEPIAGVFDFVLVHGHTLRALVLYTVFEVLRLGERKVTNCWVGISAS